MTCVCSTEVRQDMMTHSMMGVPGGLTLLTNLFTTVDFEDSMSDQQVRARVGRGVEWGVRGCCQLPLKGHKECLCIHPPSLLCTVHCSLCLHYAPQRKQLPQWVQVCMPGAAPGPTPTTTPLLPRFAHPSINAPRSASTCRSGCKTTWQVLGRSCTAWKTYQKRCWGPPSRKLPDLCLTTWG